MDRPWKLNAKEGNPHSMITYYMILCLWDRQNSQIHYNRMQSGSIKGYRERSGREDELHLQGSIFCRVCTWRRSSQLRRESWWESPLQRRLPSPETTGLQLSYRRERVTRYEGPWKTEADEKRIAHLGSEEPNLKEDPLIIATFI